MAKAAKTCKLHQTTTWKPGYADKTLAFLQASAPRTFLECKSTNSNKPTGQDSIVPGSETSVTAKTAARPLLKQLWPLPSGLNSVRFSGEWQANMLPRHSNQCHPSHCHDSVKGCIRIPWEL